MEIEAGRLLWKLSGLVGGILLFPALGLILMGQYVQASVLLCGVLAVRRGVWWLVTRRGRA
jgi:hypothetical protein